MADEPPPEAQSPENPPPPIITQEAQARWYGLPPAAALQVALTRDDLDNLFLGIRGAIIAQSDLASAVLEISNGRTDEAQIAFNKSKTNLNAALAHLDLFILHTMTNAVPVPTNG